MMAAEWRSMENMTDDARTGQVLSVLRKIKYVCRR